ncbi:MAG: DUF5916 domain-containing protein [Acidobacteriota bacterium]
MPKALIIFSLLLLTVLSFSQAWAAESKRVSASFTESPIIIDGNLDEWQWTQVEPAADFIQKNPKTGEPATEATEVRFLYDGDNLYLGIICFDSAGTDGITVTDMTRDYSDSQNDHFAVVLDTFDDDRTGFLFATNPTGAKRDAQISSQGSPNFDWDAIWHVKTRITDQGWQAEMAIPFKTLRFREGEGQMWGVNFIRRIRRKNEDTQWSPVPRPYRISRMSFAGSLEGISGLRQGRNLYLKPYVSTPLARREGDDVDFNPEMGLDVKFGVTPGLTLDLTLNTDFAQVEADEQQINLTRFSLFFPEKREFFLENASIFGFGNAGRGFGPGAGGDLIPFFTRRIGISRGRLVPILGGARLSGRASSYSVGVLSMQADEFEEVSSTNFSVVRLRRDIFRNSDVGGLFVNKQDSDGRFNRTYGADLHLRFFNYLDINTFLLKTDTSNIEGQELASNISVTWSEPRFDLEAKFLDIEENFNPEVGFVPRTDMRKTRGKFAYKPRPGERIPWIREFQPSVSLDYITDQENVLETRNVTGNFATIFQNGGSVTFAYQSRFERLDTPFEIRPTQEVKIGDYQFEEFSGTFSSDQSRMLVGRGTVSTGDFFDGEKDTYRVDFGFHPGYHLATDLTWRHDDVRLPSGEFTTTLVTSRSRYSFSTTMFLNALIQYNSALREISSNIRFNWIYKPLSDFFLVYNERRATTGGVKERALIAKFTYVFDF